MVIFLIRLWRLVSPDTRRRIFAAASGLALTTIVEGLGLVALINVINLLTSPGFSAQSTVIELAYRVAQTSDATRVTIYLGVVAALCYAGRALASIVIAHHSATTALLEEAAITRRLINAYLHAPLRIHISKNSSEFTRTLNTSTRIVFGPAFVAVLSSLADAISLVVVAIVLIVTDPYIAIASAAYFLIVATAWNSLIRNRIMSASQQIHERQADMFRHTAQALDAVREIKVATTEEHFVDAVDNARRQLMGPHRTTALVHVTPRFVLELALVGAAVLVSVYAFSVKDAASATAIVAIFLASAFRVIAPINKVMNAMADARTAIRAVAQIESDLANYEPYVVSDSDAGRIPPLPIEARNLSFSYDGNCYVLTNLNFAIEAGSTVALVGPSGAGKSTLVDLVLGLLEPTAGQILIGGEELGDRKRRWQRSIGFVPQTISLLDDTVRANIVLGNTNVDDSDVWRALETAQLAHKVRSLPGGLDSRIGEQGVRLSGGQRQRLGIARALYRNPTTLVLDEATAALDNDTEKRFIQVIESLQGRLTTIIVAHRLSTVRHADVVLFMESGRISRAGTFDELVQLVPNFARLAALAGISTG
jgi:ABC-type multidrug transport system fused ATPase/permease subunit